MKNFKFIVIPIFIAFFLANLTIRSQNEFNKNVFHRTSKVILNDFKTNDDFKNSNIVKTRLLFSIYELQCIGLYNKSNEKYDLAGSPSFSYVDSINHYKEIMDYIPKEANKYLFDQIKNKNIIIINESHNQPNHRVFFSGLLRGLYDNGFKILAVEALKNDTNINVGKSIKITDGFYTTEPRFANMLKEAKKIGFTIISYEATNKEEMDKREYFQAKHILEKSLDREKNAKVIVYCGFDHINEETKLDSTKIMMAGWIKLISGFDPLTINQEILSEHSNTNNEYTSYKILKSDFSSVFVNKKDTLKTYTPFESRLKCDLYVYHPRSIIKNNRPTWLLLDNGTTEYFLEKKDIKIKYPFVVSAYFLEEEISRDVPYDAIEINSSKKILPLILKKGRYKLVLRNDLKQIQELEINLLK